MASLTCDVIGMHEAVGLARLRDGVGQPVQRAYRSRGRHAPPHKGGDRVAVFAAFHYLKIIDCISYQ